MKVKINGAFIRFSILAGAAFISFNNFSHASAAGSCNILFSTDSLSQEAKNHFDGLYLRTTIRNEKELDLIFLQAIKEFEPKKNQFDKEFGLYFANLYRSLQSTGTPLITIKKYFEEYKWDPNLPLDMEHQSQVLLMGKLLNSGYPVVSAKDIQAVMDAHPEVLETALFNPKVVQALKDYYSNKESRSPLFNVNLKTYSHTVANIITRLHQNGIQIFDIWKGMIKNEAWHRATSEDRVEIFNIVEALYKPLGWDKYKSEVVNRVLPDGMIPAMHALNINDRSLFVSFYRAGADLDAKFPSDDPTGRWNAGDTIRKVANNVFTGVLKIEDWPKN